MMVAIAQGKEKVKGCVLFNAAGGLTSFRDEELPWVLRPLWVFVRVVLFGDIFGPGLFKRFATEENVRSVLSQVCIRERERGNEGIRLQKKIIDKRQKRGSMRVRAFSFVCGLISPVS